MCAVMKNQHLPPGELFYEPADFFSTLPRVERRSMGGDQMNAVLSSWAATTRKPE